MTVSERPATDAAVKGPPLVGRRTRLRPITEYDYEYLFVLATSEEIGFRWRHRGETPSPETFTQHLWHGVLAQFLITRKRTGDPIGQVTAYNANLRNRSVYFGMLIDPALMGAGWTSEAGALFLNYLFTIWDFRKIYIETIDFNFSNFASGIGRFFQEEGCLKENDFFNGRYWDMHILALYRRDWERVAAKYLSQLPVDESSPTSSPADVGA